MDIFSLINNFFESNPNVTDIKILVNVLGEVICTFRYNNQRYSFTLVSVGGDETN